MPQRISRTTIVLAGLMLGFLILPNVIIIPLSLSRSEFFSFPPPGLSFRWYERFFADPRWTEALVRSIRIGLATAALSSVLGVCAAFGLIRGRVRGQEVATALLMAPLVVPHVILAGGLFVFYANIGLLTTEVGLILAHTLIAFPIVTVTVMVALRSLRRDLEFAAMSLGAGYVRTFISATLPQIAPGLWAGAIFAFVSSFDETTMAIFLGGLNSTTLPMKMWEGITVESNPVLPAASTILLLGSAIPLVVVELNRRWRERRNTMGPST
jgi:ABC-type spermidine/putrescine transport system permease subunit II